MATPAGADPGGSGGPRVRSLVLVGLPGAGKSTVGALVAAGGKYGTLATILGVIAVVCATTNVVAGFLITDRMLAMFKKPDTKPEDGK